MQVDYKELMWEIGEITTVDGFVSSCLEIKESMFFYDRDLMLAAYNASLELLSVVALFSGALQGKRELHKVEEEVVRCVSELLDELAQYRLPLDIQYMVDRYLQDFGMQINLRMPVYTQMMHNYAFYTESSQDLNILIRKAHQCLLLGNSKAESELRSILGLVGTKMLRGEHLRPIWLQISHPRIYLVLIGLQTMMNNFKVTPYLNFPLEDISTERQKRKKIGGNVVLDLGVFRNFRQGGSGYTDLNVALVKDDYDHFLEQLFNNENLDIEPDQQVIDLIIMIFEARLYNEELDEDLLSQLIIYCAVWKLREVSDVVLEILELLDSEEPLFHNLWVLLQSFDGKAIPAIRRFARANRESHLLPYLTFFLSNGTPQKRKWTLLKEIFEHYPQRNIDKAQMAIAIGRYGGEEARVYLEDILARTNEVGGIYRRGLEEALVQAKVNER